MPPTTDHSQDIAELLPLTDLAFGVLLALKDDARHGYALIQQLRERSGRAKLRTGTVYAALARMQDQGLVRESTDGGRTWSAPSSTDMPEVFTFMRDLRFDPSGEVGTIVGQRGLVMRSDDAGSTWTKVLPKPKVASADTGH